MNGKILPKTMMYKKVSRFFEFNLKMKYYTPNKQNYSEQIV